MSIKVNIYNQKAENIGELELSQEIFGVKINEFLIHQVTVAQTANQRQVLAHTKDRSEVKGGGRKPWKQKGTGRARAGSIRSPIWIGGGVTFGPTKEKNFKKKIHKKMKRKAILMVLSDKVASNNLIVLNKIELKEFKTKDFNKILEKIEKNILSKKEDKKEAKKSKRSILVINDTKDEKVKYSGRNLEGVEIINLENINILDLLKYKILLLTQAAVKNIEKQYIGENGRPVRESEK